MLLMLNACETYSLMARRWFYCCAIHDGVRSRRAAQFVASVTVCSKVHVQ
jgi:hypothetical protein